MGSITQLGVTQVQMLVAIVVEIGCILFLVGYLVCFSEDIRLIYRVTFPLDNYVLVLSDDLRCVILPVLDLDPWDEGGVFV